MDLKEHFVVIPALNESSTIRDIVTRSLKITSKVIVVDDGSSDGTSLALEGLPVMILQNQTSMGKGASLWRGFQYALELGAERIITLDADGQHLPEEIPRLIQASQEAAHRLIIGARPRDWSQIHNPRVLANRVADFWISWASGYWVQDTQSGFRIYPKRLLEKINIKHGKGRGFVFESEVLIKASRLGFESVCVPITSPPSPKSRKSHFRPILDVLRITRMVFVQLLICKFSPSGLYRTIRRQKQRCLPFVLMNMLQFVVINL